jgi:peptidyl-prolyl cis-trans isomerase SurA
MKVKISDHRIRRLLLHCLCFAGVVFITTGMPAIAPAQNAALVDRIVAVVNDEIITLYDLDKEFEPYAKNIKSLKYSEDKQQQLLFQFRSDLLNKLIESALADQEIKKNKLNVTEAAVDSAIERIKTSRSMTDETLRAGLAQEGLTMDEYRKELKAQMLRSKLVNLEVKSKIVITQENIKSYFNDHPEKYTGEKKYHLWNIYIAISDKTDDSQKRTASNNMETIRSKLDQGLQFQALAKDDSLSSLGANGGDLGLFLVKELSEEILAAIENLKAGEYTTVLKTGSVYQIIYLEKVIQANSKSLEEVQTEIEEILYREVVDNKYQEWLKELRNRSHIRIIQ